MADLQQFFSCSTSASRKTNRRIMYGPSTESWPVPEGTTEVEVHVWGGGGGSCSVCCPASSPQGGGGGGYARVRYSVTSADSLCITVGGASGTSSVTIPTRSPTSPVSATGGGNAIASCPGCQGVGGIGTFSLGPSHPTVYSFTACGGSGSNTCNTSFIAGGGGGAGSPLGNGGSGAITCQYPTPLGSNSAPGSGGGIGNPGHVYIVCYPAAPVCLASALNTVGGGALEKAIIHCNNTPYFCGAANFQTGSVGRQVNVNVSYEITCFVAPAGLCCVSRNNVTTNITSRDDWFYVEDISGSAGFSNPFLAFKNGGSGAGGANGGKGGFLGGGSGGSPYQSYCLYGDGQGGCAGGSGGLNSSCPGSIPGSPGVVIIYW